MAQLSLIECMKVRGRFEQFKRLVDGGYNVNEKDENDQTILHLCHTFGETELEGTGIPVVKFLLERGADVNFKDREGQTPLFWFIERNCRAELISLLLDYRADVTCASMSGQTALHIYSRLKNKSVSVFRRICKGYLDLDVKDGNGETPLMHFLMYGSRKEYIEILLDAGSDVTLRSYSGNSILHYYAMWCFESFYVYDDLKILKRIVAGGCPLNVKNNDGATPLMMFASNHLSAKQVRFLLDSGADLSIVDQYGNSVLHRILPEFNDVYIDVIQLLFDYGADPNAMNDYNQILLTKALQSDKDDYVKILYHYGLQYSLMPNDITTFTENYPAYVQGEPLNTAVKYMLLRNEMALERYITLNLPHYKSLRSYINYLLHEVRKMKQRFVSYRFTLFDVLVQTDRRRLAQFVGNLYLYYGDLNCEFPEYADIIKSKIEFAIRVARTFYKIEHLFIAPQPGSPYGEVKLTLDCVYYVLEFLNEQDIRNLFAASINI